MLTTNLIETLTAEEAPGRIWRWVAWGSTSGDRSVRLALALHLRREASPSAVRQPSSGWTWPNDTPLGIAEAIFRERRAEAAAKSQKLDPADLDAKEFMHEVDRRLALKPIQPRRPRSPDAAPRRPQALPAELTKALGVVRKYAEKGLLLEPAAILVCDSLKKRPPK